MGLTPNLDQLRQTYRWLDHKTHGVSEIRIISPDRSAAARIAYVDNEEAFVRICSEQNERGNVYVGIQPRPIELFTRAPNTAARSVQGAHIEDIDIITRTVIDLDPDRPDKKAASTDAELERAKSYAHDVAERLVSEGYVRPQIVMSGNGTQLWFAFEPVLITDDNRESVAQNLRDFEEKIRKHVRELGDEVECDSIHDFPRIIKVIGTVSRKGPANDIDRPHRLSSVLPGSSLASVKLDPKLGAEMAAHNPAAMLFAAKPKGLPVFQPGQASPVLTTAQTDAAGRARRNPDGSIYFRQPTDMCSPFAQMWNEGTADRSLGLINAVQFFLSKQLPDEEIVDIVLRYDFAGGKKLKDRDGRRYIQREIDKVIRNAGGRLNVRPPCHSLQRMKLCPVNNEPEARCELFDVVFDLERSVFAIPDDTNGESLRYRLRTVFDAMTDRTDDAREEGARLISARFGLSIESVRSMFDQRFLERALDVSEETAPPVPMTAAAEAAATEDRVNEPNLEGFVVEDKNNYVVSTKKIETIISSFILVPKLEVSLGEHSVYECEAHCDNGSSLSLRIPNTAFESRKNFVSSISPHMSLLWVGTDNNVMGVKRSVSRYKPRKVKGISTLGAIEENGRRYWTLPDRVLTPEGIDEEPPVVYLRSGNPLDDKIRFDDTDDESYRAITNRIFSLILKINSPQVVLPILGWFFATPMKPRLMHAVQSFPTLWVHGTRGSGKTTIVQEVFWPLFGLGDTSPFSSNPTEWSLIKTMCQTTSIPVYLDEYKPQDQTRMLALHRLLREHYSGEVQARGGRNLSVNTFKLSSPIVIAGETRPTEAAILERIVTSMPDKNQLEENRDWQVSMDMFKTIERHYFAARYVRWCLGQELEPHLEPARLVVDGVISGIKRSVPIRMRNNLAAMVMGVRMFEAYAKHMGFEDLPDDLGIDEAITAVIDDLVETEGGVKDPLDHFLEVCAIMAQTREILHGRHFTRHGEGGQMIGLHFATCYDAYRRHLKQIDYRGEIYDERAMERLVEQNRKRMGWVRMVDRIKFGENDFRRAIIVDLSRQTMVEAANFPASDAGAGEWHPRGSEWRSGPW